MKVTKLCIAIPNVGNIRTECAYSTISALFYAAMKLKCGIHLFFPTGCLIDENRNRAAKETLDVGASHLMFIDSDMSFPEHGIVALAQRDKPIIGANYNMRSQALLSTVKVMDANGKCIQVPGMQLPTVPFQAYAVATGFMLIQADVFNQLDKPWFFYDYDKEGDYTVGEDVYFCKKAREKGIEVWCDPTIPMKHIGDYAY